MSSDVKTGAEETARAKTSPVNPAEASRRILEEGFNEGKLEPADQLISPQAINHDPAEPKRIRELRGPEVFKRTVTMYRTAFPDVRMVVDDVIAAGDKVALRWHSEGTHSHELEGLAATGGRVSVTGISIDQWKDGKVVESWSEWDNLGLARQLGAAPPEGSMGEKIGMAVQRLMARRMRRKHQG
jgi:predicted ester cyclase